MRIRLITIYRNIFSLLKKLYELLMQVKWQWHCHHGMAKDYNISNLDSEFRDLLAYDSYRFDSVHSAVSAQLRKALQ